MYLSYFVADRYKQYVSMSYTQIPKGVMARLLPCNLDIISEMSGNWFALFLVNEWVNVPAPKIWMRDERKMQFFLPEHSISSVSVPISQIIFLYICASWIFQYTTFRFTQGPTTESFKMSIEQGRETYEISSEEPERFENPLLKSDVVTTLWRDELGMEGHIRVRIEF